MNRRNKNRDENQEKKRDERSLQKNQNFHPDDCSCEYCQSREKREKLARNEEQEQYSREGEQGLNRNQNREKEQGGYGRDFDESNKWSGEGEERRKSGLDRSKKISPFKKKSPIKKMARSTKPKRRKAA